MKAQTKISKILSKFFDDCLDAAFDIENNQLPLDEIEPKRDGVRERYAEKIVKEFRIK